MAIQREMQFEEIQNDLQEENLGGYKRLTGEFWTARQRQMHSIHYAVSYRASFKPELPNYFISRYCSDPQCDLVFDPFGGRGTTILEANILGYSGYSNDVNPLSERIAYPKCNPVTIDELKSALDRIDLNTNVDLSDYERFSPFYHIDTYREILALQSYLQRSKDLGSRIEGTLNPKSSILDPLKSSRTDADRFIEMIALSRLHGHSGGFFSVYSFPQISVLSVAQARINKKRNQIPDYRPIKPRILKKAKRVLSDFSPDELSTLRTVARRNIFTCDDTRNLSSIPDSSVALIVTSPPFLNKADYLQDNWLEFWFLGIDPEPLRKSIVQTDDLEKWSDFMRESLREMFRVLRPAGVAVIEVGEVSYRRRLVNLDEIIVELGRSVGFSVEEVLINSQQFTKLANCFKVDNMTKGTNTNRLVVLRKP